MTQATVASTGTAAGRRAASGRRGLLVFGGAALISGLDAGLIRLGVWAPVASEQLGQVHGQVMVLGFLGTLISLERAQALGRGWGYLAPALLGLGGLALILAPTQLLGQLLQLEGALLLVLVYLALWRRAPRALVAVQLLAAVFAAAGAVVVATQGMVAALPCWIGFLVLTIAAERAELAQLVLGPKADQAILSLAVGLAAAILTSQLWPPLGERLLGVVLLAGGSWLLWHDVVRRQLRLTGQRRYLAGALLLGYLSLLLAGAVLAWFGLTGTAGTYDVVIHAVFLGFGMSMVMAHAPVILPAVLGLPLPYRAILWLPLVLLHLGLMLRFGGDLASLEWLWRTGGVLNVLALLTFFGCAVTLVVKR